MYVNTLSKTIIVIVSMLTAILTGTAVAGNTVFESNWNTEVGISCSVDDSGMWSAYRGDGCSEKSVAPFYVENGTGPSGNNALKISSWRINASDVSYSYVEKYTDYLENFYDQSNYKYSYFRFYIKVDSNLHAALPNAKRFHMVENKHSDARNFYWGIFDTASGSWRAYVESFAHEDVYRPTIGYILSTTWLVPDLPYNEWLRIEMKIDWSNDYDTQAHSLTYWRVYNSSGTLIADNDDIVPDQYDAGGTCDPAGSKDDCTLTEFYAAGYHWVWTGDQFGIKFGDNGPESLSTTASPVHICDFSAFKWTQSESGDDWIGPVGAPSITPQVTPQVNRKTTQGGGGCIIGVTISN